jgi:hypothetical protein
LKTLLAEKHSFYIYDCKDIVFTFNENKTDKSGLYKIPYDTINKLGYYLSDEAKKKFKVSLSMSVFCGQRTQVD